MTDDSTRPFYIAVIGDMRASKSLSMEKRREAQHRFAEFIDSLNGKALFRKALSSKFVITLGDEFQGILHDAIVLPDLIWEVRQAADLPEFRLGIGYGHLDTEIPAYAINLDGPALHAARQAIDESKNKKLLGGVFSGFGKDLDPIANGIAQLLQFHIARCTAAQRTVIGFIRQGMTGIEIAERLARTPQAVSANKHAAGADAFIAGERALRDILKLATQQSLL